MGEWLGVVRCSHIKHEYYSLPSLNVASLNVVFLHRLCGCEIALGEAFVLIPSFLSIFKRLPTLFSLWYMASLVKMEAFRCDFMNFV